VKRGLVAVLAAAFAASSCALAASSCSRHSSDEEKPRCPELDSGRPVDPALLAFLSRARSAHHVADGLEEQKQLDRAVAVLEELLKGPQPAGQPPPTEVREVLSDTRARIADLESRRGRFESAEQHLKEGLELARETTYFRGHLYEVRGLVEERRSKDLSAKGESGAAESAKQRALEAFEESMKIQEQVIKNTVPGDKP
jgi:tetratricopeptide (TPR) repeat protein